MKKPIKKYKVEFVTSSNDPGKLETKILTHFGTWSGSLIITELPQ